MMKIMVIGLGSMGKRRIRLLRRFDVVDGISGVDGRADRRAEAERTLQIPTFADVAAAVQQHGADCAFVCTSPLSHGGVISECLTRGLHVFTEINLVNDLYEENIRLAEERGRALFLSSTFLYRKEIDHIRDRVRAYGRPLNYCYHVGQYLPDWHPWESYTQFFVGDKRSNACREILAIELPWIFATFGPISGITSLHDRNSDLHIAYDDNYIIQLTHTDGCKGVLCVDVVSPRAVRNLEVFGEHFQLTWDGTPEGLREYRDGEFKTVALYQTFEQRDGYQHTIVEDAYAAEIQAFLDVVARKATPRYDFAQDNEILSWIDRIEA